MQVKAFVQVLVKKIFPLVMGLVLLAIVIAWLAGAFEAKIQPDLFPLTP